MEYLRPITKALFVSLVAVLFAAGECRAAEWTEQGDAGQALNTAQAPVGTGSLSAIHGTILPAWDVDMFKINIPNFSNFSATTINGATFDTQLALFNTSGLLVDFNDDFDWQNHPEIGQSTLPTANAPSLSPGDYFLAISSFNVKPVNTVDVVITPGSTDPLANWSGPTLAEGPYSIFLEGANFVGQAPPDGNIVPEPATLALLAMGLAGLAFLRRKD